MFIIILCPSWGFFSHKRIARVAIFTLPKGMLPFYKANIDFITEHAVDPDKRRYIDSTEGPHHFFDADHYGKRPFDRMPQRWAEAERQYSADSLDKYGTVPWTIQRYYYRLVRAFKAKDTLYILKTSANLSHYIADAHVPLHMTSNYNGQFTHQEGIHSLWETRVPELFSDSYRYNVGRAHYIESPLKEAWKICHRTYRCVDSTLMFEQKLNARSPADKKYQMVKRNGKSIKDYSPKYAAQYQTMLHGMVERQMRMSIIEIGSFWFSAWVDAGQPDLSKLIDIQATAEQTAKANREQLLYRLGKVPAGK
jgi:hypothetical protein